MNDPTKDIFKHIHQWQNRHNIINLYKQSFITEVSANWLRHIKNAAKNWPKFDAASMSDFALFSVAIRVSRRVWVGKLVPP